MIPLLFSLILVQLYIFDQSSQTLLTRIPETTAAEFNQAVDIAAEAFNTWSRTSVITRQKFAIECVSSQILVAILKLGLASNTNSAQTPMP